MNKKYVVKLSLEERQSLEALVNRGRAAARKIKRAWVLLQADAGPAGPSWSDEQIQQAYDLGMMTIYRTRQTWVEEGLQAVLAPQSATRRRPRKLDGEQEAHLIALACSQPPAGRRRWTLRLLAGKMVELGHTDRLSPETVRQTLKKRTEAASGKDVVHSTRGQRRIRVAHGRALAGANKPYQENQDDGILTATEVAGLNLSKVELAVLSACDTELGEAAAGEGLLGTQRAFQVAGAKSVVGSLWEIDDKSTRDLMMRFYENLWDRQKPLRPSRCRNVYGPFTGPALSSPATGADLGGV